MEILDLVHLLSYCILPEGVTVIIIKLDGLLNIPYHLDHTLVLDGVLLSLGSKDPGHPNELLGIISEVPLQLPNYPMSEVLTNAFS